MPKYLVILQDTYTRGHIVDVEPEANRHIEMVQARYDAGHIHSEDHFSGHVIREHYGNVIFSRRLDEASESMTEAEVLELLEEHGKLPRDLTNE